MDSGRVGSQKKLSFTWITAKLPAPIATTTSARWKPSTSSGSIPATRLAVSVIATVPEPCAHLSAAAIAIGTRMENPAAGMPPPSDPASPPQAAATVAPTPVAPITPPKPPQMRAYRRVYGGALRSLGYAFAFGES